MSVPQSGWRSKESWSRRLSGPDAALPWLKANGPALASNALAGLVASLLTIAYCLSFSVLLFQGALASGLAQGLWAFLVGSAVAGLYVSLTTSLPPAEAAPDNPAAAVLSVLAATVAGQVLAAGGSAETAVSTVLLSFSLATLVTGLVLYALGRLRLGQVVRFVPYPVIGGFLAASGWFLVTGGIEVMTGRELTLASLPQAVPADRWPMLLLGAGFGVAVYALRVATGSMYVLPVAFLGGTLALDAVLWSLGLMHGDSRWFVGGASEIQAWVPLRVLAETDIDWSVFVGAGIEIAAVAGVTVIALLLDVTGLEVARTKSADLDWEFRSNGAANILAAPLGGVMGNLSMNGSRLLEETGGFARASGVIASLVVALVVVTGVDLTGLVPKPVLAGLLIYLGLVVLADMLLHSPAHRAWMDFALALLIMAVIVAAGYLAGILFGIVAACLLFAFNYSRIAIIRRHLTRTVFASNTERSAPAARLLAEEGERIHVFWLAGYIFFGSSNGVFENIRAALGKEGGGKRRYAVLDLADVSGFDTSALLSLVKLRNFADDNDVTLVFAALSPRMTAALEHLRLLGPGRSHRAFQGRNDALQWCEEQVLADRADDASRGTAGDFEDWLAAEVGGHDRARRLVRYFERRDVPAGTVLYRQGSPSDRIDLVVAGTVAITVSSGPGHAAFVRRMSTRTVIGEMGFFRNSVRAATVAAEQATILYSLDRNSHERLRAEEPEISSAFLEFIIRAMSDRLEFANQGIAALS